MTEQKIALVTGGNRGIGLQVCRGLAQLGYRVYLGSRDLEKGKQAAGDLEKDGQKVLPLALDVGSAESISAAVKEFEGVGRLDVLVNNAGKFFENMDREAVLSSFVTNSLGPYQLCLELLPLMKKNNYGRIVNVSSGMGQLTEMNSGYHGYRISKTALNAITRIFSEEGKENDILVNSVCPGWVRTDMGGPGATRSVQQGAETIVWAATLPSDGPTGSFLRDKKRIDW